MTEMRLDYDRSIVPQITAWSCGAAAAEIVLNAAGLRISEQQLIREIGTTERGTDHIGQISRVLARYLPEAGYTVVEMPRDPPSPAEHERLWEHITRSIAGGRVGLVANWVVPASNRPRGVKGSVSPGYPASTTFHYVAYMGFADGPDAAGVPGNRAVWVADSANFGGIQGFWISAHQAGTLIPWKGYCHAANAPALAAPPPPAPGELDRVTLLSEVMGGTVSRQRYEELLPRVADALIRSDCLNVNRVSMWIAQVGHESVGFKYFRELWGPTSDQQSYEGRRDLGNTQPGDGHRFLGRGPIQITGRHNYTVMSQWAFDRGYIDDPQLFVNNPTLLETDEWAFYPAIWYWTTARSTINAMSDARDLEGVTRAINGGLNGLPDRRSRYDRALSRGDALLSLIHTPDPEPPPPEPEPEIPVVAWADEVLDLLRENNALLRQLAAVNVSMAAIVAEGKP